MTERAAMNKVVIAEGFSDWMAATTAAVINLTDRWTSPHVAKLVEKKSSEGVVLDLIEIAKTESVCLRDRQLFDSESVHSRIDLSDRRVELHLLPDHFIFRRLELPNRAGEFLGGIVRAQLDSLTPWTVENSAFGWSEPKKLDDEHISIDVAATTRKLVRSYVDAVFSSGAHSISIVTSRPEDDNSAPIGISEERAPGSLATPKIRRSLIAALGAASVTAIISCGTALLVATTLDSQMEEIGERTSRARALISNGGEGSGAASTAEGQLILRKQSEASTVLVIEDLSRLLPDHTYLKELKVEGTKLRITGITKDAPSLIGAMEGSGRFTQASFFAPTTRMPSESDERFHIEANIQASSGSGS